MKRKARVWKAWAVVYRGRLAHRPGLNALLFYKDEPYPGAADDLKHPVCVGRGTAARTDFARVVHVEIREVVRARKGKRRAK